MAVIIQKNLDQALTCLMQASIMLLQQHNSDSRNIIIMSSSIYKFKFTLLTA